MAQVVAAAVALLATWAACLWWLWRVPDPRWDELGAVGILVVGVCLVALAATVGWQRVGAAVQSIAGPAKRAQPPCVGGSEDQQLLPSWEARD
jgi:hypothetical protein